MNGTQYLSQMNAGGLNQSKAIQTLDNLATAKKGKMLRENHISFLNLWGRARSKNVLPFGRS